MSVSSICCVVCLVFSCVWSLLFLCSLWVIDGYVSVCVRKPESACFCSLCVTSLVCLGLSVVSVWMKAIAGLSGSILTTCIISRRSTLHQASTQPCYLLPTLSPGLSPGAHLSRVPTRTRQPAASDRPGHPPAPGTPSAPHCPACTSVPGCSGASIPTSGLTPAIPHPAAASWSAAPQDSPAFQVELLTCMQIQIRTDRKKNKVKHLILSFILFAEEPRSVFPWTLTDCVQAMSTPLPSMSPSQWHSSNSGTWPKALTGESLSEINESPVESRNDPVLSSVHPSVCLSHCLAWVYLVACPSVCRDLSVDAGLPHHQYQLQQLPQHYQHYLASPRMHHFPRNTSSAQVVSLIVISGKKKNEFNNHK